MSAIRSTADSLYCISCKKKSPDIELKVKFIETVSKYNRPVLRKMLTAKCFYSLKKKNRFISISSVEGAGLINDFMNRLPFEIRLPGHNFTGPGTKLDKKLTERHNGDLEPKDWSKPINRVDEAAMHHDIWYLKNKETKGRN